MSKQELQTKKDAGTQVSNVTNQQDAIFAVIERAATDPNFDAEKMEKMLGMQERIFEKNAEIQFSDAMAKVQGELPAIVKQANNAQTKSKYAKIENILTELKPISSKYGFSMIFGTGKAEIDGWLRTTCKLLHVGGHSIDDHVDLPLDTEGIQGKRNKTDIHGAKSAITYARGILTCLMFNVTTTDMIDDDGNAAGAKPLPRISEEQAANINSLISEVGANKTQFLKWLKIDSVENIPLQAYETAIKALEKKRK